MSARVAGACAVACALLLGACDQLVTSPSRYTALDIRTERRDSSAVRGVQIILYTGQRIVQYATTDAQGRALMERVPEGPAYGVRVVKPDGYEFPERLLGGPPSDFVIGLNLRADSTPVMKFRLLKVGPGTAIARVMDTQGAPVVGADVELYAPAGVERKGKTGADGRVSFSAVPFGQYGVRAYRPVAYRDFDESAPVYQDGLLIEDGVTATGTLSITRCQGTINLRVADPVYGGAPGILAYLFFWNGVVDSARTGSDGTVRWQTPGCADYGVRIVGTSNWRVTPGRGSEFTDGLVIHRGTVRDASLVVQYNTCRGAIRVTVVDGTGALVPGAGLTLYAAGGGDPVVSGVATTGTGTFGDLACGPPERGVRVTPPSGWTMAGAASDHVDGLVVTSGATLDVRFTLTRVAP